MALVKAVVSTVLLSVAVEVLLPLFSLHLCRNYPQDKSSLHPSGLLWASTGRGRVVEAGDRLGPGPSPQRAEESGAGG